MDMRAELTIPEELIEAIAERLTEKFFEKMKPLLSSHNNRANDDVIFDIKDLCKYLNVSEKWVYERTRFNEIPFFKIGNILRFRKRDIDKWIESYKVPAADTPKRPLRVVK